MRRILAWEKGILLRKMLKFCTNVGAKQRFVDPCHILGCGHVMIEYLIFLGNPSYERD
jgi:hypothetical protein